MNTNRETVIVRDIKPESGISMILFGIFGVFCFIVFGLTLSVIK